MKNNEPKPVTLPPSAEGVRLPPPDVTLDDLAVAVEWMKGLGMPASSGHIQVFAERAACRDRQLLAALTSLTAAQDDNERYLTQAHNAEVNAVYQQRRANKAEAEVSSLRTEYEELRKGRQEVVEDLSEALDELETLKAQLASRESSPPNELLGDYKQVPSITAYRNYSYTPPKEPK